MTTPSHAPDPGDATRKALASLQRFAFSTLLTTLLRFAFRLAKTVILTRVLGPEGRGLFGLLNTVPGLAASFGNLGYGLGSVYLLTRRKTPLPVVLGNALVYLIVHGALLTTVCVFLFMHGAPLFGASQEGLAHIAPFALAGLPFVLGERLSGDLMTGIKDIHFLNLLHLMTSILPVATLVLIWQITGDALTGAMWGWLLAFIIITLVGFYRLVRKAKRLRISFSAAQEAFSFGLRGNISQFANAAIRRIDMLFIAYYMGPESLGYYAAAVSIVELTLAAPDAVAKPFMPLRMEMEDAEGRHFSPLVVKYVLAVMAIGLLLLGILAEPVMLLLFGEAFLPGLPALLWLLPGILALSVYQFFKADLYSLNKPGLISCISLIVMLFNVAGNILLIPRLGIAGAAITSSICYTLMSISMALCINRLTSIPLRSMLLLNKHDVAHCLMTLKQTIQKQSKHIYKNKGR